MSPRGVAEPPPRPPNGPSPGARRCAGRPCSPACCPGGPPGSVLVANPGVLAARLVREKLGVPTASLLLQPGLLPSSTAPPEMPGGLTIPGWLPGPLRRLYWLGVDAAGYALVARSLNRVRAGLGLS